MRRDVVWRVLEDGSRAIGGVLLCATCGGERDAHRPDCAMQKGR